MANEGVGIKMKNEHPEIPENECWLCGNAAKPADMLIVDPDKVEGSNLWVHESCLKQLREMQDER